MTIGASNNLLLASAPPSNPAYKLSKVNFDLGLYSYSYPGVYQSSGLRAQSFSSDGSYLYTTTNGTFINQCVSATPYYYPFTTPQANYTGSAVGGDGAFFKADGTRFWTVYGTGASSLRQASLGSAFDLTTTGSATIASVNAAGSGNRSGVFFNTTGTKLYISSQTSKTVEQYSVATAWDITGGITYDSKQLSVGTQITAGTFQSVWIKPDGLTLWAVASANPASGQSTVYEYTLATAWDVSTATYASRSFTTTLGTCPAIGFKDDGTYLYFILSAGASPYAYGVITVPLGTAWNLTSAGTPVRYTYSSLKMSAYSASSGCIVQGGSYIFYTLPTTQSQLVFAPTAWDYSAVKPGPGLVHSAGGTPSLVLVKNAGTKAYVYADASGVNTIYEYTLSTASNLDTATYTGNSLVVTSANPGAALDISGDGSKLIVIQSNGTVKQYLLTTPWNLSTATYDNAYALSGLPSDASCRITYASDGSKIVVYCLTTLYTYTLGTAWDVSTVSGVSTAVAPCYKPASFSLVNSGNYLFTGSNGFAGVYELQAANDVSSSVFASNVVQAPSSVGDIGWYGMSGFNAAGTAFYTYYVGYLRKFTLSTPWDMNTATLAATKTGLSTVGMSSSVINEEHLLIATGYNDTVVHYKMTTPGDVSTTTLVGSYSYNNARAATFSTDGNYAYIVVDDFNAYSYPLGTPFNLSTAGASTLIGSSGSITDSISLAGANDEYMLLGSYSETNVRQYVKTGAGAYAAPSAITRMLQPTLYGFNDWMRGAAWVGGQGLSLAWMTIGFSSVTRFTYVKYDIQV